MKIKMVSYYAMNPVQVFATFEYQQVQFDMFKNLEDFSPKWKFMEDEGFLKLNKIANIELIEKNCYNQLSVLDSHLDIHVSSIYSHLN